MYTKRRIALVPLLAAALTISACGMGSDPASDAAAAIAANDHHAARLHLAALLKEQPDNVEARYDLVGANLAVGDGIAAESALDALPDAEKTSASALALRGHAKMLRGDFQTALDLAEQAGAGSAKGSWVKVAALLSLDRFDAAVKTANAAVEQHPEDANLLAIRGELALHQRKVSIARGYADRALAQQADNLAALMLAGKLALMRGEQTLARDFYAKAADRHPLAVSALLALSATQADLGDLDAARDALARLRQVSPNDPMAAFLSAKIAFVDGDLNGAQKTMAGLESQLRDVPAAQLLLGEIAHLRGNHATAISHLRRFMKDNPGHIQGATVLAQAYLADGDERRAWEVVRDPAKRAIATPHLVALASRLAQANGAQDVYGSRIASRQQPIDAPARLENASRAMQKRDWATASGIYAELRKQGFANNAMVLNNAALAELGLKNNAAALKLAREAIALTPDDPQVIDTMGWVLMQTGGSKSQALDLLARAHKALPGNLEVRWHYAAALAANGRKGEARQVIAPFRDFADAEQREHIDRLLARL